VNSRYCRSVPLPQRSLVDNVTNIVAEFRSMWHCVDRLELFQLSRSDSNRNLSPIVLDLAQAAVRRPFRWRLRHDDRAFPSGERFQQRLLGLGRRGRRHGEPDKGPGSPHFPLLGQHRPLQDAHAQEGEGESQTVSHLRPSTSPPIRFFDSASRLNVFVDATMDFFFRARKEILFFFFSFFFFCFAFFSNQGQETRMRVRENGLLQRSGGSAREEIFFTVINEILLLRILLLHLMRG
jgi:hypothetical protein